MNIALLYKETKLHTSTSMKNTKLWLLECGKAKKKKSYVTGLNLGLYQTFHTYPFLRKKNKL